MDFFEAASRFSDHVGCCSYLTHCMDNCKVAKLNGSLKQNKIKDSNGNTGYEYWREYGREHLINCCSKRRMKRCECISYWWIIRFLLRVFDVTLRTAILLLSWILLGGAVTFVLLIFEGILLFFGIKKHNSFAWLTNIVILPLNTEETAKRFTEIYVFYRLFSNVILIALFYVFAFDDFDCIFDICDPYELRYGILTNNNNYSNSFLFSLLVYVTVMYYLGIFPYLLLFVSTYLVDTDNYRSQDHSLKDLLFVGDWHGITELLEFGFISELYDLRFDQKLDILENCLTMQEFASLGLVFDCLAAVNVSKDNDIRLSRSIIGRLNGLKFGFDIGGRVNRLVIRIFENTWKLVENDNIKYIDGTNEVALAFADAKKLYDLLSKQYKSLFTLEYVQNVFNKTVEYYQNINQQHITSKQLTRLITLARMINYAFGMTFDNTKLIENASKKATSAVVGKILGFLMADTHNDSLAMKLILSDTFLKIRQLTLDECFILLEKQVNVIQIGQFTDDRITYLVDSCCSKLLETNSNHTDDVMATLTNLWRFVKILPKIRNLNVDVYVRLFDMIVNAQLQDYSYTNENQEQHVWKWRKDLLIELIRHAKQQNVSQLGEIEWFKTQLMQIIQQPGSMKDALLIVAVVKDCEFDLNDLQSIYDKIEQHDMIISIDMRDMIDVVRLLLGCKEFAVVRRLFITTLINRWKQQGTESMESIANCFDLCCDFLLNWKNLHLAKEQTDFFMNELTNQLLVFRFNRTQTRVKRTFNLKDNTITCEIYNNNTAGNPTEHWNDTLKECINKVDIFCIVVKIFQKLQSDVEEKEMETDSKGGDNLELIARNFFQHCLQPRTISNNNTQIIIPDNTTMTLYEKLVAIVKSNFTFLDSLEFWSFMTNELVENLAKTKHMKPQQRGSMLLRAGLLLYIVNDLNLVKKKSSRPFEIFDHLNVKDLMWILCQMIDCQSWTFLSKFLPLILITNHSNKTGESSKYRAFLSKLNLDQCEIILTHCIINTKESNVENFALDMLKCLANRYVYTYGSMAMISYKDMSVSRETVKSLGKNSTLIKNNIQTLKGPLKPLLRQLILQHWNIENNDNFDTKYISHESLSELILQGKFSTKINNTFGDYFSGDDLSDILHEQVQIYLNDNSIRVKDNTTGRLESLIIFCLQNSMHMDKQLTQKDIVWNDMMINKHCLYEMIVDTSNINDSNSNLQGASTTEFRLFVGKLEISDMSLKIVVSLDKLNMLVVKLLSTYENISTLEFKRKSLWSPMEKNVNVLEHCLKYYDYLLSKSNSKEREDLVHWVGESHVTLVLDRPLMKLIHNDYLSDSKEFLQDRVCTRTFFTCIA